MPISVAVPLTGVSVGLPAVSLQVLSMFIDGSETYNNGGIVTPLQATVQQVRTYVVEAPPPLYVIESCGVVQGDPLDAAMRIRHEATQLVDVKLMAVPVTLPTASVTRKR